MKDDTLILVAAVAAVFLLMNKKAAASTPAPGPAGSTATSINNQLWTSILGGAWKSLVAPSSTGSGSGFLMTNDWGQVVTSDGKPVDSSLPAISGALSSGGFGSGYSGVSDSVDTSAPDGTNWLGLLGM